MSQTVNIHRYIFHNIDTITKNKIFIDDILNIEINFDYKLRQNLFFSSF